jgi:hypothetical protein
MVMDIFNDYHNYLNIYKFDMDYIRKYNLIKMDPYKYLLSNKDRERCYHRVKRAIFMGTITGLYVYQNLRYHQELGRVKNFRFNVIQMMHLPKVAGVALLTYLLGNCFFVERQKLKMHDIARIEVQKFDKEWFTYEYNRYTVFNAPAYKDPNSQWGIINFQRLFYDVDQDAGWMTRRRQANPDGLSEVPPKYETTPQAPRDMSKTRKDWPFFNKNEFAK